MCRVRGRGAAPHPGTGCVRWLLALAFLVLPLAASAQAREYQQSEAVLAGLGPIPITLDSPALTPGHRTLTTYDEMLAHVKGLASRSPNLYLGRLGFSRQGRELPVLVFTAEGLREAAAIRALGRPILWLIGQQHGNEPAGGEAMLAIASALATGELRGSLQRVTVVIVPRLNPDGAEAATRTAADGSDLNRDHLLLTSPEVSALHAAMAEMPPDLVLDAHEFQVAGAWLSQFGAIQKSDAMLLQATHPAVVREIASYAEQVFIPAIGHAFEPVGLSWSWYYTAMGREVSLGGNSPGISRNNFAMSGAVSILVETRGIGVGRQGYQRRVATHYLAAKAVIEQAATEPDALLSHVGAARRRIAETDEPIVIEYRTESASGEIPLADPRTAAEIRMPVDFTDTRRVSITRTRLRPVGYLIQPAAQAVIDALKTRGVHLCEARTESVVAEAFLISAKEAPSRPRSINPEGTVEVSLVRRAITPAKGAVVVPIRQEAAVIVSAALEPDSPGSFIGSGLIPVEASGETSIYRLLPGEPLPVSADCPL
ncbi:M14 family zinc carboxypeptidase [Microvirga massiliensis]|uniref:M14 family zinc carboxypeptidase n=1 Tax=Microvirga massiliensis TaxID=1033741 RepID=UPI00062BEB03|nr:M14 family zinc carboxypeptidase [Microvirga massiliensis]